MKLVAHIWLLNFHRKKLILETSKITSKDVDLIVKTVSDKSSIVNLQLPSFYYVLPAEIPIIDSSAKLNQSLVQCVRNSVDAFLD